MPVPVGGRDAALALLRDIGRDAWGRAALRRLYAETVGRAAICWESDHTVMEGLARRLVTGELKARSVPLPEIEAPVGALLPVAEAPAPAAPKPAPPPPEEAPPDDLLEGVEAEALEEAAEEGATFCEDCAQEAEDTEVVDEALAGVDDAEQAAALENAANDGTPFCEECEKQKHAA